MREIKFRFWNKRKKGWVQINFISYEYDGSLIGANNIAFDDIKVMQYTGLKDKNSKEIYEDDIVKYKINPRGGKSYYENMLVNWDSKMAGFGISSLNSKVTSAYLGGNFDDGRVNKRCEVLGNIYENPELLKDKQ